VIYQVVVTASARADAVEGFRWIADQSPDAAARWYVGLEKAIVKLTTMPERHPIAQYESEQLGITLRRMLYGRRRGVYRLLFSIEGKTVILHYVCHSARNPSIAIGR
jgi:plasmid stabilization system protein ParE